MNKVKNFMSVFILTAGCLYSCQKELSCEDCATVSSVQPPVAIAGVDKIITLPVDSILLNGAASYDPDGNIVLWKWRKISGPDPISFTAADSASTLVNNLFAGTYLFELKVTDGSGLIGKDTVQVTVDDPAINQPPVVWAGNDTTIFLPANTIFLRGIFTDPENNISAHVWSKISGPTSYDILNPGLNPTQAMNLVEGIYQFELRVTDTDGLTNADTMQATVKISTPTCSSCKIAFVSDRNGSTNIYSCNADGSAITQLTNVGNNYHPTWSPDGTRIAFVSDRTGSNEIFIMNGDGSNVVRRTFINSYALHPTWSPDGSKIAFSSINNGSLNIWVVGAISGTASQLFQTPGYDDQPRWSPDGSKIAFVSDWAAYDFVYDIFTVNVDGTGFTTLTGNIFDHVDYLYPSWSPDGTRLAMTVNEIGQTKLGVMNADGTGLNVIASGVDGWTGTSWSGDGSKIVYTSLLGGTRNISWVLADGTAGGLIVTNGWYPDWQH